MQFDDFLQPTPTAGFLYSSRLKFGILSLSGVNIYGAPYVSEEYQMIYEASTPDQVGQMSAAIIRDLLLNTPTLISLALGMTIMNEVPSTLELLFIMNIYSIYSSIYFSNFQSYIYYSKEVNERGQVIDDENDRYIFQRFFVPVWSFYYGFATLYLAKYLDDNPNLRETFLNEKFTLENLKEILMLATFAFIFLLMPSKIDYYYKSVHPVYYQQYTDVQFAGRNIFLVINPRYNEFANSRLENLKYLSIYWYNNPNRAIDNPAAKYFVYRAQSRVYGFYNVITNNKNIQYEIRKREFLSYIYETFINPLKGKVALSGKTISKIYSKTNPEDFINVPFDQQELKENPNSLLVRAITSPLINRSRGVYFNIYDLLYKTDDKELYNLEIMYYALDVFDALSQISKRQHGQVLYPYESYNFFADEFRQKMTVLNSKFALYNTEPTNFGNPIFPPHGIYWNIPQVYPENYFAGLYFSLITTFMVVFEGRSLDYGIVPLRIPQMYYISALPVRIVNSAREDYKIQLTLLFGQEVQPFSYKKALRYNQIDFLNYRTAFGGFSNQPLSSEAPLSAFGINRLYNWFKEFMDKTLSEISFAYTNSDSVPSEIEIQNIIVDKQLEVASKMHSFLMGIKNYSVYDIQLYLEDEVI